MLSTEAAKDRKVLLRYAHMTMLAKRQFPSRKNKVQFNANIVSQPAHKCWTGKVRILFRDIASVLCD
jgi:hypothetical protein